MKQDMKTWLLTEKPGKLLFKLAVPGIIGMIVIGLYPFMDGVFAGRIIGDYGMSAISIGLGRIGWVVIRIVIPGCGSPSDRAWGARSV